MIDFSKLGWVDVDGDGYSDGLGGIEQTLTPGSAKAKKLWQAIQNDAHSPENIAKAKEISGNENARGMFMGKPLVPGSKGTMTHPEGDYDYLVCKLFLKGGYDFLTAKKIASSISKKLYG